MPTTQKRHPSSTAALAFVAPLLAALVAVSIFTTGRAQPMLYDDVMPNEWCSEYVAYVSKRGIMVGYQNDEGNFHPYDSISRASAATVLHRIATGGDAPTGSTPFKDVSDDDWFAAPVAWCLENGIVDDTDVFQPNDPVSVEELAMMFFRLAIACGVPDTDGDFSDFPGADEVSPEARQAFGWCIRHDMLTSRDDTGYTPFAPQGDTQRAQCAKMSAVFCANVLDGKPTPFNTRDQ